MAVRHEIHDIADNHPVPAQPSNARLTRLDSVDTLRGLVMVLMVLDHTRDFFSDASIDPSDLAQTTPALFLTRWITDFCAPVFAFLAGTGAYLAGSRGKARGDLARFLATRGLRLIFLEQTVEKFGITFVLNPGFFLGLVLWSIGWSMVVLAGLLALGVSSRNIAVGGVVLIATHNLADGIKADDLSLMRPLAVLLHQRGLIALPGGMMLFAMYPLIPWVGMVMAGFGFGEILEWEPGRRRRALLGLGLGLTAAFVVLRAANVYGDPRPWSPQGSPWFTLISFLHCEKYRPSLLYLMMTLGPAIASLAWFDRLGGTAAAPLATLGRVPLFY